MTILASSTDMAAKLTLIAPEILLFAGAVVVAVLGLAKSPSSRRAVPFVTAIFLAGSIGLTAYVYRTDAVERAGLLIPMLGGYAKALIAAIGILLVMVAGPAVDRRLEEAFDSGRAAFDPIRTMRGEYFAFFLLAIAGTMLIANASDLVWLFLALELASLPTYVMVAVSRGTRRAQEAAVKYFFLGALAAATFLYGFALLYGATGTLELVEMKSRLAQQMAAGGLSTLAVLGGTLAVLGISFKLAAVPMHFYAPDVYEGASTPTTAFLAFVPKMAGVLALFVLLSAFGWSGTTVESGGEIFTIEGLPPALKAVLWMVCVLTMTLGNVGALLQRNVKRMLAYSSIAHSGYVMMAILAGPTAGGLGAALFYMLCYGVMNTAAMAALASLERQGEEVETLEDLSGLRLRQPALAWILSASAVSLIGMPPLVGFFGKLALFTSALEAGQMELVLIAAVNSAISAVYYLQLVSVPMFGQPKAGADCPTVVPSAWPRVAAVLCGVGVAVLPLALGQLVDAASSVSQQPPSAAEARASERNDALNGARASAAGDDRLAVAPADAR